MYSDSDKLIEVAETYRRLGFSLFPCHSIDANGSCTCGTECGRNKAKHPLTHNGVKAATLDSAKLAEYFTGNYSIANIAVATGEPSGVFVLDVDVFDDLSKLENVNGKLPPTPIVKTGNGLHYYFRFDDRCRTLKNAVKFCGGLDVRATGGYVLLPPSIHASGRRYEWLLAPDKIPFATAPDWLLAIMPKHGDDAKPTQKPKQSDGATQSVAPESSSPFVVNRASTTLERATLYASACEPAISGSGGHATTFRVVCNIVELFGGELNDDELLQALTPWNERCEPSWSEKELRHKLADARRKIPQLPQDDQSEVVVEDWPTLHADALHGLGGDVVRRILPHSECDAVSLLTTFLIAFGVAVGRRPFYVVEGSKHHTNEFLCVVGRSSKARKGTSFGRIAELFADTMPSKVSGLSTGEGLINAVRDAATFEAGGKFETTQGVVDKRRLVYEPELAKTLKVMRRESNTLSAVLRDCWDSGTLNVLTKGNPLTATDSHIGIVSHITTDEFRKVRDDADVHNGFFNRFCFALVKRSKLLPDGGNVVLDDLRERLRSTIEKASAIERMERSEECRKLWREVYAELCEEKSGAYDAATSRAEAHVLRLSMIYALTDDSPIIEVVHLKAALALWRYCDESARRIFGVADDPASKLERRFLKLIVNHPGIMKTELRRSVSHATTTAEIDGALQRLINRQAVVCIEVVANGRQAETYYAGSRVLGFRGFSSDQDAHDDERRSDADDPKAPKPQSPTPPPAETQTPPVPQRGTGATQPATLAELFDFRNRNSLEFVQLADGSTGVSSDNVPPEIAAAIQAYQSTLATLVPIEMQTPDDDLSMSLDEFIAHVQANATETQSTPPDCCCDADGKFLWKAQMTPEAFANALEDDRKHGYTARQLARE